MDYFVALMLGLVEGITEFLPVSSTGHLILAGEALGFVGERANVFEIFIQLGAILAVAWTYRATFSGLVRGWRRDPVRRRLVLHLALAFLPAAVAGLLAHRWIKAHLFGPVTVGRALVGGGVAILVIERWRSQVRVARVGGRRWGACGSSCTTSPATRSPASRGTASRSGSSCRRSMPADHSGEPRIVNR